MNTLKPCPFCDGEADIFNTYLFGGGRGYYITCAECSVETHINPDKQPVIDSWNKRVDNAAKT